METNTREWKRDPRAETVGTWLIQELPDATDADIRARFGEPNPHGCMDPDKGYDGREYSFTDAAGCVGTLYCRWGIWRVGGRGPATQAFADWIVQQLTAREIARLTSFEDCIMIGCTQEDGHDGQHSY